MNSLFEKIYFKSPVLLQNFAVGLLGLKLANERFQKEGDNFLEQLEQTFNFKPEELKSFQEKQFLFLAKHAIDHTEFYKNWANENNIRSSDVRSIDDLNLFPVIEKQLIREHPEWFKSNYFKNQFNLNTSGTTGTPLTIFTDKASRSKHYAFFSRLRNRFGINRVSRRATLFGRIIMEGNNNKAPFWRYDWYQKNLLMSSYHLSKTNVKSYYDKLLAYKPDEIFAYPSSLTPIAEYIIDNSLSRIQLKLVMTTAENLSDYQRELINKAFDAPLINQYGCTEMSFFMVDDGEGMIAEPEHGILEVRDNNGVIKNTGSGELIATGLINLSMPIIRYAIGDDVVLTTETGGVQQKLASLKGRVDDVLYKADGTPVGRLDPIFKGGKAIKIAQIIQKEDGSVVLKIVPSDDYHEKCGDDLKLELQKRFDVNTSIALELVNDIAKQKNGKFRPVISNYKPLMN